VFLSSHSKHLEKVQKLGLANAYHQFVEIKTCVGMMDGLAFLPLEHVNDDI
jgi:hypothetical protein